MRKKINNNIIKDWNKKKNQAEAGDKPKTAWYMTLDIVSKGIIKK